MEKNEVVSLFRLSLQAEADQTAGLFGLAVGPIFPQMFPNSIIYAWEPSLWPALVQVGGKNPCSGATPQNPGEREVTVLP